MRGTNAECACCFALLSHHVYGGSLIDQELSFLLGHAPYEFPMDEYKGGVIEAKASS